MFDMLINCIKGTCTIKAEGRFPERILNIASTSGIYIRDVKRDGPDSIIFSVSKKGGDRLLLTTPEGLTVSAVESYGLPVFLHRYKKRVLLFFLPLLFLFSACIFSLFIWRIEIEGGDKALRSQVRQVISENGIYAGALKHKVDNYKIKHTAILEIDDLSWLWVDVRGTTAKVKIRKRTPKPALNPIHEPADVIAMHSGVIEKIRVYCGVPLAAEGTTVEKGQVIISGIFKSENENIPTYYHHATGEVILRVSEEKTVIIPKKAVKKTPTDRKKSVFTLNFKKNNIIFSLNSGISYTEYDKIEKRYELPLLPVSFSKIDYMEMTVTTEDTDIPAELESRRKTFLQEIEKKNMELVNLTEETTETEHEVKVTFLADCRVRTDKEIPISDKNPIVEGETDGEIY